MSGGGTSKSALLTVGSTHFDELVKAALEPAVLKALRDRGVTRLIVQYGEGNIRQVLRYVALDPEEGFPAVSGGVTCTVNTGEEVTVEMHPFLDDIDERMGAADLVICHAGAGSILAALRGPALSPASRVQNKQLVIVPNDSLMASHQSELADEMAGRGWAAVASPRTLATTLQQLPATSHTANSAPAFPVYDPATVQGILDEQMAWT